MGSHGSESNEANNFPSSIPELLEILPKRETKLQIRMGNPNGSHMGSSNNSRHRNHNHTNHHSHSHHNNNSTSSANDTQGQCYHTLRYDFKPASINSEKPASLDLTQTGQVTIKATNVVGSISNQTVFRGQRRPHVKECLLVIDNNTGEMFLQKLTDNISVKLFRGPSAANNNSSATSSTNNSIGSSTSSTNMSGSISSSSSTSHLLSNHNQNHSSLSANNLSNSHLPPSSVSNNINDNNNYLDTNNHHQGNINHITNNLSSAGILPLTKNDGPQLSEESSSSSNSSGSSRSRTSSTSSSSSSSSSSNSGNSSPNNEGFTF